MVEIALHVPDDSAGWQVPSPGLGGSSQQSRVGVGDCQSLSWAMDFPSLGLQLPFCTRECGS